MSQQLRQFCNSHKVNNMKDCTHTGMGSWKGKYRFVGDDKQQLTQLIAQAFDNGDEVCLVERPMEHSITRMDLDFNWKDTSTVKRRFNKRMVKDIVKACNDSIIEVLGEHDNFNKETQLTCCVLMRNEPYVDQVKQILKDGIHLFWPSLISHYTTQFIIREKIIKRVERVVKDLQCDNNIDDIVDKAVIKSNGMMPYGCTKPGRKPYVLQHIFNHALADQIICDLTTTELVTTLSIRDSDISKSIFLDINKIKTIKKNKTNKKTNKTRSSSRDVKLAKKLVKLLSVERANEYETWNSVGICLHNIDCKQLLDDWIAFSQTADNPDTEEKCIAKWQSYATNERKDADRLKIGSLHHWAQLDDPEGYAELTRRGKGTLKELDVVEQFIELFGQDYRVVASGNKSEWFNWNGVYWEIIPPGQARKHMVLKLREYHQQHPSIESKSIIEALEGGEFYSRCFKRLTDLLIVYKIEFDVNPYVFMFNNKVFCLKTNKFIEPCRNDMTTFTAGYNIGDRDEKQIERLSEIIDTIFPDPSVKRFYLIILATGMLGRCLEHFVFATGKGGNGKGVLNDLAKTSLGDYAHSPPMNILTLIQGNGASPELANLHKKRLLICSEPNAVDDYGRPITLKDGQIKKITGGGTLTARHLYKNSSPCVLHNTTIMECNQKPDIAGQGGNSIDRRVIVVKFPKLFTISKAQCEKYPDRYSLANPYYKTQEFQDEFRDAMFYLLADHFKLYRDNGYSLDGLIPQSVMDETNDYLDDSNLFMSWFNKHYTLCDKEEAGVTLKDIHAYFISCVGDQLNSNDKKSYSQRNIRNILLNDPELSDRYCKSKVRTKLIKQLFERNCVSNFFYGVKAIEDDEY